MSQLKHCSVKRKREESNYCDLHDLAKEDKTYEVTTLLASFQDEHPRHLHHCLFTFQRFFVRSSPYQDFQSPFVNAGMEI